MSDRSPYALTGEVHPFIQKNTKNTQEIEAAGGEGSPWDQQPDETATAYSAFLLYLDLGLHDRSHTKVAQVLYGNKKSTGSISKWSVDHDWMNRADAWDRYVLESYRTRMVEVIKDAEKTMTAYLPKVVLNLSQAAAGEKSVGRAEMRAISDFLDRVGPAKQQRSSSTNITNNVTVQAPDLPGSVVNDTDNVPEVEVIEESAQNLIPDDLQQKRGKG